MYVMYEFVSFRPWYFQLPRDEIWKVTNGLGVQHICMDYPPAQVKHIQVHFEQNFAQLAKLLSCPHSLPLSSALIGQVKFSLDAGTFHWNGQTFVTKHFPSQLVSQPGV